MAITLTSPKIIAFFSKYPKLAPNDIAELIIDIFEVVSKNIDHNSDKSQLYTYFEDLQSSVSKVNNSVIDLKSSVFDVKSSVTDVKSHVAQQEIKTDLLAKSVENISQSISSVLLDRFQVIKSDFLEDTRNALYSYNRENHTQFQSILEKNQTQIIRDTESTIRSVISPDSFDKISSNITSILNNLHSKLQQDTNLILQQFIKHDDYRTKIEHFIESYKTDLDSFSQSIKQPINVLSQHSLDLNQSVSDLLSRYNNSSDKGKTGEAELLNVLNRLYPSYEIVNTTGSTGCGDFIIKRNDKTSILIETKDYSVNVPSKEVDKFIRDTESNRMSGIFLSQCSGIATKPNWGLDLFGSFCRIYVHNVKYNPDIVHSAIQLLDMVEERIIKINKEPSDAFISISEETALKIDNEINNLIRNRNELITRIEVQAKQNVASIRELHVPNISDIISGMIGKKTSCIEFLSCLGCNKKFNNRIALGSHYKGCKDLTPEMKQTLSKQPRVKKPKNTTDEDKESE